MTDATRPDEGGTDEQDQGTTRSAGGALRPPAPGDLRKEYLPVGYKGKPLDPSKVDKWPDGFGFVDVRDLLPCRHNVRVATDTDFRQEMMDSIRGDGVLMPLLVHAEATGAFVIAGMQRWTCSRELLDEIPERAIVPVRVYRGLTDRQILAMTVGENSARSNLRPWEEVRIVQDLLDGQLDLEELALNTIREVTRWSVGKASHRRTCALGIPREVVAEAGVTEDQMMPLTLDQLAAIAKPSDLVQKVARLRRLLRLADADVGATQSTTSDAPGVSYRYHEKDRRHTLTMRVGSMTREDHHKFADMLVRIANEIGGPDYERLRSQASKLRANFAPKEQKARTGTSSAAPKGTRNG